MIFSIENVTLDISYIIFEPESLSFSGNENGDSSEVVRESGLNWIIIGILLLVVGILVIFFLQTYIFLPRKEDRELDLISRTQKFRDIRNIQAIILKKIIFKKRQINFYDLDR